MGAQRFSPLHRGATVQDAASAPLSGTRVSAAREGGRLGGRRGLRAGPAQPRASLPLSDYIHMNVL